MKLSVMLKKVKKVEANPKTVLPILIFFQGCQFSNFGVFCFLPLLGVVFAPGG
jgi:hypothetical protein